MAGRLYGGMMERVADEVTWMPSWMSMAYMCLLELGEVTQDDEHCDALASV